ncbi:MAG: PBP1A family penicillin-binding protein [Deltaproteobacteria bacterium]|nr:PBP1A family penicillin-binding protein [Deltaproteobacteria bacterium]
MAGKRKRALWILILLILAGLLIGFSVGIILSVTRDLPQIQALEEFQPSAATRVYSADGQLLAQFFIHRRLPVSGDSIPHDLKKAVISVEDRRFYRHAGLDVIRNFGALIKDIQARGLVQGASTITQQLARNLFLTPEKTITRKLKEIFLALQIERRYTKDEILELYLNQIPFGTGAYGVEAAAEIYFGKKASDLTLPECALLAGLPRSPARYSPFNHPQKALARRRVVLRVMLRDGHLNREQFETAVKAPLKLVPRAAAQNIAPYFSEHIRRLLVEKFGQNMVYRGGLEVQTSLNYHIQEIAEKTLVRGLRDLNRRLARSRSAHAAGASGDEAVQGALVVLEPGTGRIIAMVGGKNFSESPFNRAVQAFRQPGSAIKPIIYAAAVESGLTQADRLWDAPITFNLPGRKDPWKPQNYSRRFEGEISLRRALEISENIPAIKLLQKVGIGNVIRTARSMGLTSPLGRNLALALGTSEVTLIELVSAYNCLAGGGVWIEPWGIAQVRDRSGLVIFEAQPQRRAALSPETAYIMTDMLKGVITHGTGRKARVLKRPLAGKTGTTDRYRDALFVGYSPQMTVGVWVGYDSGRVLGCGETGARAALPVWVEFMEQALAGKPTHDFKRPVNIVMVLMDRITGARVSPDAPGMVEAAFKTGTEPKD